MIPSVGIVLHNDEPAAWLEVAAESSQDIWLVVISLEVKCIGDHDAVQSRKRYGQVPGVVGVDDVNRYVREP